MRATRCDRYRCAQNADHFAHNSPFSAFFAEVVCTLGTTPPRTVISPPPEGGLHYSRLRHVGDTPSASSSYHKDPSPPTWRPLHSGLIPTPQAWRTPQDRQAWLRCPWAAAGPGRASRRRAERSSRRGRLAGGPPPTGTPSSPAPQPGPTAPRTPAAPQNNKTARPHRGRAAQQVSEAHRRITTMSGSPRPLSWRTLEIPSLAAISFAVPSKRGSS